MGEMRANLEGAYRCKPQHKKAHSQACAADFNLSLGDIRGLLAGSWVVRHLGNRVRDGLNLA